MVGPGPAGATVDLVDPVDPAPDSPGPGPADHGGRDGGDERPLPGNGSDAEAGPDGEAGSDGATPARDPLRFNSWMKRSATGAVMTGIAVGLQQALELPRQEPAFVIEASGEPDDPNRAIDLHFDPDNPADSVAIVRRRPAADDPEEPSAPR